MNRDILIEAEKERNPVLLQRRWDDYRTHGYPVAVGEEWLLIHLVNTDVMALNGYEALRLADLTEVTAGDSFVRRAMERTGQRAEPLPTVDLTSTETLLHSVGGVFPLLTIATERSYRDEVYIGRITEFGAKTFLFGEVDPEANWHKGPRRYHYSSITKVQFGDGYGKALWSLAQDSLPEE